MARAHAAALGAAATSAQADADAAGSLARSAATAKTGPSASVAPAKSPADVHRSQEDEVPYLILFMTYASYVGLIVIGYVRDLFGQLFKREEYGTEAGFAPLVNGKEDFYTRRMYQRIQDCWARPICSTPGAWIDVVMRRASRDRKTLCSTNARAHCLNLGSYNYLGYGEIPGGVNDVVYDAMHNFGIGVPAPALGACQSAAVTSLERTVAEFLGKEAAVVSGMGFATNAQLIPALVGPGCVILSDALNHSSIVVGARLSGARIRVFAHNDAHSLEAELREAIVEGQPHSGEPWNKILIIVEGVYSMEGEVCELAEIVAVKKKYGAYLYLDEAHSIGALGATGRGVTEYAGVNPADVDILMGTFTKSFGAVGGYIASDQCVIDRVRYTAAGCVNTYPMSPVCARHVEWVFHQLDDRDRSGIGGAKIKSLRDNSIYFRQRLEEMGLLIYGDYDSPVIPIMLFQPGKIAAFSRECLKRQVAVVVVGFPATPLILSRARICISAAHTREDLDMAIEVFDEVSELLQIKYRRKLGASASSSSSSRITDHSKVEACVRNERLAPPSRAEQVAARNDNHALVEAAGNESSSPAYQKAASMALSAPYQRRSTKANGAMEELDHHEIHGDKSPDCVGFEHRLCNGVCRSVSVSDTMTLRA
ncbi:Long chain base biosynthesis protein 2d [Porphyridium purpureum]|uniref:serine C-palmitoyltransferase n=1 Tax=Porphyridium purpureum TaxID=35688 RepID=A0A5J4YWE6_PORPP|nr:Long chain base biosynthesis protein 2d [Porphyridium purpureum]|eukprot:POR1326..scf227_4